MTAYDITALVKRLRSRRDETDHHIYIEAADALEAQRDRIKELADENWASREGERKATARIAHLEAWNTNLQDADDRWVVIVGEQNQEIVELEVRIAELEAERDAVLISDEDLLGAIARGWCHPENSHKVMDEKLAIAIDQEVRKLLQGKVR